MEIWDRINDWWHELRFSAGQRKVLALLALAVLLISTFFLVRGRSLEVAAITEPAGIALIASDIIVDVAGGVVNPGVYTLPTNSRVIDAITAAGGLARGADASDINQARTLRDGEQIYIYSGEKSNVTRAKVRGPISINRASKKDFESLNGIGPVLASRIIAYRNEFGPFMSIDDLLKVPGIKESTLAKFKEKIRV